MQDYQWAYFSSRIQRMLDPITSCIYSADVFFLLLLLLLLLLFFFLSCTQESYVNVNAVWNWNCAIWKWHSLFFSFAVIGVSRFHWMRQNCRQYEEWVRVRGGKEGSGWQKTQYIKFSFTFVANDNKQRNLFHQLDGGEQLSISGSSYNLPRTHMRKAHMLVNGWVNKSFRSSTEISAGKWKIFKLSTFSGTDTEFRHIGK